MFHFGKIKKSNTEKKKSLRKDLGDGFYLEYIETSNGFGGYHPVNIVLKNDQDKKCRRVITDKRGNFVNFPGVKEGPWVKEVDGKFVAAVQYTFSVSKFVNGVSRVIWLVQPDGRYFADEDGFGAEKCSEIKLYSIMNTRGEFLCPFTDEPMNGDGRCYLL